MRRFLSVVVPGKACFRLEHQFGGNDKDNRLYVAFRTHAGEATIIAELIEHFDEAIAALRTARRALESGLGSILATQPLDRATLDTLRHLTARHAQMASQLQSLMGEGKADPVMRVETEQLSSYFDNAEGAIALRLREVPRYC
jgi:hypothetical protein